MNKSVDVIGACFLFSRADRRTTKHRLKQVVGFSYLAPPASLPGGLGEPSLAGDVERTHTHGARKRSFSECVSTHSAWKEGSTLLFPCWIQSVFCLLVVHYALQKRPPQSKGCRWVANQYMSVADV